MASLYLNPPLCANMQDGLQCPNYAGRFICSGCRLVQYCGEQCQAQHWPIHKAETCKSALIDSRWKPAWFTERRAPTQ